MGYILLFIHFVQSYEVTNVLLLYVLMVSYLTMA